MKLYEASARVTISLHQTIQANSAEEARDIAEQLEMPLLCFGCQVQYGNPTVWEPGDFDGEPEEICVEK